ncbi:TPA: hypothetical protein DEP90_03515, partial [Patescibacteria group bacterium]|nr:hypothetical protein [Patescibacteria group bacterium]
MRNIDIKQRKLRKGKAKWHIYLPTLIISFLGIFLYFYATDKVLLKHALLFIFKDKSVQITYETFDIYIDELVKSEYEDQIIIDLNRVMFNEVPRFNIVENENEADVKIDYGVDENTILTEYLLPVGHIYWVNSSISSEDLMEGIFST